MIASSNRMSGNPRVPFKACAEQRLIIMQTTTSQHSANFQQQNCNQWGTYSTTVDSTVALVPWGQGATCERWRRSAWPEGHWSSSFQNNSALEFLHLRWLSHRGSHPASLPLKHKIMYLAEHNEFPILYTRGIPTTHLPLSDHSQRIWAVSSRAFPQWWQYSGVLWPSNAARQRVKSIIKLL